MRIIKKMNDFINESVEIKDNKEFNNIIRLLEEHGYNLIDVSVSDVFDGSLYFVIEGEYPFTISYCDNGTNLMIIVELEDGTTDSLGCFSVNDNIVKKVTNVIISYCEQTIEDYDGFLSESIVNNYTYGKLNKFVDKLEGKKVSFYSKGEIFTELINDIELTPDEEDRHNNSEEKSAPYNGDVWFNDKKVDLTKEIKIIK